MVDSPCIGVCEMADDLTCAGCRRTLSEITHWLRFTDAEKSQVLAAIAARKAAAQPNMPPPPDK